MSSTTLTDKADVLAELQKLIKNAFDTFDIHCNGTVDVRELGTVVRSLGCVPTEEELQELLTEVEEAQPTGFVYFDRFYPVMTRLLDEGKYQSASYNDLLNAFKVLDESEKGFVTKEELRKYLTEEGEPFTEEEMEEMLIAVCDPEKDNIDYKEFTSWLVVGDDEDSVFVIKESLLQQLSQPSQPGSSGSPA